MKRDFVAITDFSREEIFETLALAKELKELQHDKAAPQPLAGKSVGLIFHKPSLRTRISFEVGVSQLGGNPIYITQQEIELGKRETIYDAAKVLSRYLGMIEIRTFSHDDVVQLAKHADVPVINGLTDLLHPCQVMSDIFTVQEKLGRVEDIKVVYLGDGNNVANSWINLASLLSVQLVVATSEETPPNAEILEKARTAGRSEISVEHDPRKAAKGAHVLYTDVWASMGHKDKSDKQKQLLSKFQLNSDLMSLADKNAIAMHCLPAERGREITDEVMDGPQSVVFDQAENRLHMQKAIMTKLLV
ncbi:ornithine carbamoyltransferase [bacterium]|nr:ornithine carbamoyltransferase [bacterium]